MGILRRWAFLTAAIAIAMAMGYGSGVPPRRAARARDRLEEMVRALKEDDASVRARAARAIGRLGPEGKAAVPAAGPRRCRTPNRPCGGRRRSRCGAWGAPSRRSSRRLPGGPAQSRRGGPVGGRVRLGPDRTGDAGRVALSRGGVADEPGADAGADDVADAGAVGRLRARQGGACGGARPDRRPRARAYPRAGRRPRALARPRAPRLSPRPIRMPPPAT